MHVFRASGVRPQRSHIKTSAVDSRPPSNAESQIEAFSIADCICSQHTTEVIKLCPTTGTTR
eukprot:6302925-Amphidinium_carterae.1